MSLFFSTIIGKFISKASKLRGGGSALPGLVVEKIDPNYLKKSLHNLPRGVVVVSGTNGKTTTTKIVVELLESSGLKVITNKTGSNFTRGVIASILSENNIFGKIDADVAVFELDEAHAKHFIKQIKPRFSLLLNVMHDQLDRFGEVEYTASLLKNIALATTEKVIINNNDTLLLDAVQDIPHSKLLAFDFNSGLSHYFPSEHPAIFTELFKPNNIATLTRIDLDNVDIQISKEDQAPETYSTNLQLKGAYNALNATAALALTRIILGKSISNKQLVSYLSKIKPAFGRGEVFTIDEIPLELILIKNSAGFNAGLNTFSDTNHVMIALNDAHADGRDLSWLWNVNTAPLSKITSDIYLTGARATDMALRLAYEDMDKIVINPNIKESLSNFLHTNINQPKTIFCSYTAMLEIRRHIIDKMELRK